MSERVTESELREFDNDVRVEPYGSSDKKRLVAEVRRLRGLIVRANTPAIGYGADRDDALDALEAEAEAIRAEEGR